MVSLIKNIPVILRLFLPLIAGVVVSFYTGYYPHVVIVISVLIALIGLTALSKKIIRKNGVLFTLTATAYFFLFGAYLSGLNTSVYHEEYFNAIPINQDDLVQVKLIEQPEEKENSIKSYVEVLRVNDKKTVGKALLYFQKSQASLNLAYGDELIMKSSFQKIRPNGNPKEFDYARYLKIHDVRSQAYVPENDWILIGNSGASFFKHIYRIRDWLDEVLTSSGMSANNLMVARALIIGKKESLDRETLRTYSSAGAMHVLAVSGLHVGIVMLILNFILSPIKRLKKGRFLFLFAVVSGIWFYALVTGLSSSVMRAAVMFSFVTVGLEIERETSVYQSIMVSAFLMILLEPLVIFQVGFQLSYLAVLGIVYIQPKIYNLMFVRYKFLDKIWQITSVSIAAQFATFPLGLFYFHQFPNFFMLSNLIVIPLAFAILLLGFFYFFSHWIPVLEQLVAWIFDLLLTILNKGVGFVEQLPHAIYWGFSIHWYEVFLLYAILLSGTFAFVNRKKKAFFLALSFAVVLLGLNVLEDYQLSMEKRLVVYNISDDVAVDVFYGRSNCFYASEELMEQEEKLLFYVKHNWFYRTGEEAPGKHVQIKNGKEIIPVGEQHLLIANKLDDSIPLTAYVLIHHVKFIPEHLIELWRENRTQIILGAKISFRAKRYILDRLPKNQIHDLSEQGAYELSFG